MASTAASKIAIPDGLVDKNSVLALAVNKEQSQKGGLKLVSHIHLKMVQDSPYGLLVKE